MGFWEWGLWENGILGIWDFGDMRFLENGILGFWEKGICEIGILGK